VVVDLAGDGDVNLVVDDVSPFFERVLGNGRRTPMISDR
jgi:hypothetical protein